MWNSIGLTDGLNAKANGFGGVTCWMPPVGMRSFDGSLLDGRLDNRKEIAAELGLGDAGEIPNTELVLRLYRRHGIRALSKLVGDWRAVIQDEASQTVTLAVDHAGCRPLFYRWSNRRLRWSSSLRTLIDPSEMHDLDAGYMAAFLAGGPAGELTPFRTVRAVMPGQAITVSADRISRHQTWAFPSELADDAAPGDLAERLRELFTEAVSVRLQSPAPVMAECSGGLDSSLIVCVANEQIRSGLTSTRQLVAMHYAIDGSDDARFQAEVVSRCQIESVRIHNRDCPLLSATDECPPMAPMIGAPRIREVRRRMEAARTPLLLTGQLGDLVMGNVFDDYDQAADHFRRGRILSGIQESFAWSAARRYPVWRVLGQAARSAAGMTHPADWYATMVRGENSLLPERLQMMAIDMAHVRRREMQRPDLSPSHLRRHYSLRDILDGGALRSPELLGDGNASHPFSHRPLLEFMLSIPTRHVCGPTTPRKLMREAFSHLLPPAVLHRRSKASVTGAVYSAVRETTSQLMRAGTSWRVAELGFVDSAKLKNQLARYLQGLPCAEHQIHQMVTLEAWLRSLPLPVGTEYCAKAG